MKKMLGISACLTMCLLGGHASSPNVRATEPGLRPSGNYSRPSPVNPRRGRRAPVQEVCTQKKRYETTLLPEKPYTGTLKYPHVTHRATFTIGENQTFILKLLDGSDYTSTGKLYAVTNCGETTVVMQFDEPRRAGPTSIRKVSARACRRGSEFSLTSLGGTFSFKTDGDATGGIPFEWGRCKS